MKRVLITGAGGFLGSNFINSCFDEDIEIIAVSSQKEKLHEVYQGKKIEVLSNLEALELKKWNSIDVLVNCAFPRNSDGEQMAIGLKYISDVLNKAVEEKVGAVINISSQSVYSQKRISTANEMSPYNLETQYAVGKYASELMTNSICKNLKHTNIRMASLIGPEFEQRIVNILVKQAVSGNDLYIKGGNQRFGFLDVIDAADAIIKIVQDEGWWDEAYNLGIEGSYSLLEIAECIKQVCEEYGIRVKINLEKSNDWKNSELDCKKMYERFNWKPKEDLNKSVSRMIQSYII